jgi:hypothetical protein
MNALWSRCRRALAAAVLVGCALLVFSAPAWAAKQRPQPAYHPFFGDLHAHTAVSDGSGTAAGAFRSARAAGMDFFAVTDHSMMIGPQSWPATRVAADAATTSDFVGIAAYELGWWYDHVNVFGLDTVIGKNETSQAAHTPAIDFVDVLLPYPAAIGQFNHPMWHAADFDGYVGRTPERDATMSLLEVYNWGDDVGDGAWETWSLDSYVRCLDAGWHVMPTAVSDSHYVDWDTTTAPYAFRSVLLARELTRADLYAAMRARRGYATMDADLRIDFTAGGAIMGAIVAPASRYVVAAEVTDPDALIPGDKVTRLELVSDGGAVVAARNVAAHSVSWTLSVASPAARFYFLHVTTADGDEAWTAPVWTGR